MAAAVSTVLAILQFRKTDVVTPYEQQVRSACNRIQQVRTASTQSLVQGLSMSIPFPQDPNGGAGPPAPEAPRPPGAMTMPAFTFDKASVVPALQSTYDSMKLEFDLLDRRTVPSALRDQKTREEAAKDTYLATLHTTIEEAEHDLPNRVTLNQVQALFWSPAADVEINDAMSALAGGDCSVTPPLTQQSPAVGGG